MKERNKKKLLKKTKNATYELVAVRPRVGEAPLTGAAKPVLMPSGGCMITGDGAAPVRFSSVCGCMAAIGAEGNMIGVLVNGLGSARSEAGSDAGSGVPVRTFLMRKHEMLNSRLSSLPSLLMSDKFQISARIWGGRLD